MKKKKSNMEWLDQSFSRGVILSPRGRMANLETFLLFFFAYYKYVCVCVCVCTCACVPATDI